MSKILMDFINKNWDRCIRENRTDNESLIGLPYPYSVPNTGCFDEMYYWDTYFTNVGLILSDRAIQAKFNVDNMLYMVNRFGFMLNGNRTWYLDNTQPPFLSEMVKDIYEYYNDKAWLLTAYTILKKEYSFWMKNRISPIGLNIYSGNKISSETVERFAKIYQTRTGYEYTAETKADIAHHCIATAESGWDMNPRWENDAYNYVTVDLNSLMFGFEMNMAYFADELCEESSSWIEKAKKRKELMIKYMTTPDGVLLDYNFKEGKHSKIFSAASLYPLFVKMADNEYARIMVDNLHRIKGEFGVFACEKNENDGLFQWNYPNGWPPHQFIAIKGLLNYGYTDIAKAIAKSYIYVVEKNFELTGNLWEKYNMIDGTVKTNQELNATDDLPEMMGWTAGSYLFAKHILNEI